MAASGKKDVRKIIDDLRTQGWHVEMGGKHYRARHPKGDTLTISVSPSCPFAVHNIKADIKRVNRKYALVAA